jgi:hypothetical protein
MLHSAIVAGGGVLLLALSRPIERVLAESGPERMEEGRLAAA